jgi:hypothetical protein
MPTDWSRGGKAAPVTDTVLLVPPQFKEHLKPGELRNVWKHQGEISGDGETFILAGKVVSGLDLESITGASL